MFPAATNTEATEIENIISDITILSTEITYNTKATETENKVLDITNLP